MALNVQEEGITVVSMCPGWVASDSGLSAAAGVILDGPSLNAPTSIAGMLKFIDGFTLEQNLPSLHWGYCA